MKKRLMTILVVEDNKEILNQISWHISKLFKRQVQIFKATTLKSGMEIYKKGLIDSSIIDIGLPDGNGEDLIAFIKRFEPDHPIVVQTTIEDLPYQLKILKGYEMVKYLTKETLFNELSKALIWVEMNVKKRLTQRIYITGRKNIDSLSTEEVIFVTPNENDLKVKLYNFETKKYYDECIKNMTLKKFEESYNGIGYFMRVHNSYLVNLKMIKGASKTHKEVTFIYKDEKGYDMRVEIGDKYKGNVFCFLKGLN